MKLARRIPRGAWLAAFWLAAAAIGVLSLLPPAPLPTTGWDKANHALGFLVLGLLGLACWPHRPLRVLAALLAYGGAIELAQGASGLRMAEWGDWVADGVGLALAFLAAQRAARLSGGKRGSYSEM